MNCVKVILDRFPVIEIQMYKLSSFDDEYIFYMYILGFLQVSKIVPLCVNSPTRQSFLLFTGVEQSCVFGAC